VLTVVRETYLDLPVIVRTADESSIALLQKEGATEVVPEVLEGSLMLGSHALMVLGIPLGQNSKKN
jgi:CPA2 family monovalent cation:H+ antiporter-2